MTTNIEQDAPQGKTPERVVSDLAHNHRGKGSPVEVSGEEQSAALEWFLSDHDATPREYTMQINVGSREQAKWIDWTIKPVDMDRLRQIRKQAQTKDRTRRLVGVPQEMDDTAMNIAVVVAGTVDPDLRAAARSLGAAEPGVVVRSRFQHKPGLLAQIAGEVMAISGYDDDDVREVDAVQG